ncbi:hypothetical protein SAMN05444003_2286 [Cognatiyoonia sediminum]|uniref:Alpha/beta hydrolase n=1 Tax=Cognatiyoonia sediminum TaxID=1508389 RepID=A0A1M5QS74_9RHOB|nr:hypothetical protein [Cognatiyoonia sediminum]SHH16808.1 hypothetical protein SAMN05444003_2286 [Cognatiyoonia sediminum]
MLKRSTIHLQEKLMQTWPGRALDPRGIVRISNESGEKHPIFWIFNSARTAEALAKFLGPDQPIVFTRSTTLMFSEFEARSKGAEELSRHALLYIKKEVDFTNLRIGTACEGNKLLSLICADLKESGAKIPALYLINCSLLLPALGLPALLIYGDEDLRYDPFCDPSRDAEYEASCKFSKFRRVVLPAKHARYFTPKNIRKGWENYEEFLSELSISAAASS